MLEILEKKNRNTKSGKAMLFSKQLEGRNKYIPSSHYGLSSSWGLDRGISINSAEVGIRIPGVTAAVLWPQASSSPLLECRPGRTETPSLSLRAESQSVTCSRCSVSISGMEDELSWIVTASLGAGGRGALQGCVREHLREEGMMDD